MKFHQRFLAVYTVNSVDVKAVDKNMWVGFRRLKLFVELTNRGKNNENLMMTVVGEGKETI